MILLSKTGRRELSEPVFDMVLFMTTLTKAKYIYYDFMIYDAYKIKTRKMFSTLIL